MSITRMSDLQLRGQRVLIREDLNVPVEDGRITSTQRLEAALPTIRAARDAGAERTAPQKLNEAEALLNRAEDSLERRAYREARRSAIAARDKAAEALGATQPGSNTG